MLLLTKREIEGGFLAHVFILGYDFAVMQNITFGFEVGYTGGSLSELEINERGNTRTVSFEKGVRAGFARLEMGGGLRFHF